MVSAAWYRIHYTPGFPRGDPRNVGVVLQAPQECFVRFLGETADGAIDEQRVAENGIDPEVYRTWVDYFRRKAMRKQWGDVERLQTKRRGHFVATLGGHLPEPGKPWEDVFEALFDDVVERPVVERPRRI